MKFIIFNTNSDNPPQIISGVTSDRLHVVAAVTTASAGQPVVISVALEISGGSGTPSVEIFDVATNASVGTGAISSDSGLFSTDLVYVRLILVYVWTRRRNRRYSRQHQRQRDNPRREAASFIYK